MPEDKKTVPLWFECSIKRVLKSQDEYSLTLVADIEKSNFIEETEDFKFLVFKRPMRHLKRGNYIRITHYTTRDKMEETDDGNILFSETGVKYEVLVDESWELLFEDYRKGK